MEHETRPDSARPSFDELVALTRRLYCVIRLADLYGIDLADAHVSARRRELEHFGLGDKPAGTGA